MKTNILGASGFIGSHLLHHIEHSFPISIRNPQWEKDNTEAMVWINLVGKAHDHKGNAQKEDYITANVQLTKNIFQAFLNADATVLIHVSSIAALEEFDASSPLNEEEECRPVSTYGKTKREAELWLLSQKLPEHKKLIIIRPPMIHGAGDKGNLGLLYKLISKGIPYPLASFNNNRSFISIQNFCFLIHQMIQKYHLIPSGVYHVSDDEAVSTIDLIAIIQEVTNKKVPNLSLPKFLVNALAKIGDFIPFPLNSKRLKKLTGNLVLNNQKIKSALGIEILPLSAKEGLRQTIQSFMQK